MLVFLNISVISTTVIDFYMAYLFKIHVNLNVDNKDNLHLYILDWIWDGNIVAYMVTLLINLHKWAFYYVRLKEALDKDYKYKKWLGTYCIYIIIIISFGVYGYSIYDHIANGWFNQMKVKFFLKGCHYILLGISYIMYGVCTLYVLKS